MRKKVGIVKRMSCLLLIFLLSINSFAAIVSDNDGSAFITKAEFDALKSSFQSQIDTYNQSIDSKIDGAIASYLAGIRLSNTQEINPDFKVDSYIGMSGSNNVALERTKSDYLNINCVSIFNGMSGSDSGCSQVWVDNLKTTTGKDTTYKCRLIDNIDNTDATTKSHAEWLGYNKGELIITGTLHDGIEGSSSKSWAAASWGMQSNYLCQGWGWAICKGTEESTFGAFTVSDGTGFVSSTTTLVNSTVSPFGSVSGGRNYTHIFGPDVTRTTNYTQISHSFVSQYDNTNPKVENKYGYEWFCNDGNSKDWSTTWVPFNVTNKYFGYVINKTGAAMSFGKNRTINNNASYIALKVTSYPSFWGSGHLFGCPYKGYNENIKSMDDLYDTTYSSFVANLNSTNNCKSAEQYSVGGQQVWCQSMGFPLTKIQKDGTLEIEFNRKAGANDYVVRICKGAQSKDYALNTTIPYAITTDLNGKTYNTTFGGFILSGNSNKIKFNVARNDILTVKFIPLNTAKTAFDGYIEMKPIENMVLTFES